MDFVEGTYRHPRREWQVFIFTPDACATQPVARSEVKWKSGVTGIHVMWPSGIPLNKDAVLRLLSEQLGVDEWEEIRGPDSMQLR